MDDDGEESTDEYWLSGGYASGTQGDVSTGGYWPQTHYSESEFLPSDSYQTFDFSDSVNTDTSQMTHSTFYDSTTNDYSSVNYAQPLVADPMTGFEQSATVDSWETGNTHSQTDSTL